MNRYQEKDISGCALAGIMDQSGKRFSGKAIIDSIAVMHERFNGLGGGFAAYGIYPEFSDYYAFHLIYDSGKAKDITEEYIKENFLVEKSEPIPTRKIKEIKCSSCLWRYFLKPKSEKMNFITEEDFIVDRVMNINSQVESAFVASSGKNMGIFKGVGYPEDIGVFFRLEEYEGYLWTGHGRFPTNSVAWWGGAHPFGILDWSLVHNGEISSYGINKRFLANYGYVCSFFTDTEVIIYFFDLLIRKHKLPFEMVANILSAPFWEDIDRKSERKREILKTLRIIYASALLNGPFSVIAANTNFMVALNDRIKLRPLVASTFKDKLYIASEESAIREVCNTPDKVWRPKAGEPVIGKLKE
jgi:glutamate synthase domain-containing protein 1